MYFYFSCDFPAVIKFRGVIYGILDNNVKYAELSPPFPLTEIQPIGRGQPITFFPDRAVTEHIGGISVTDLKGGYLLRFRDVPHGAGFKVFDQKKADGVTATCFCDGGCKLCIESGAGFYAEDLNFIPNHVKLSFGEKGAKGLLFALLSPDSGKLLKAYSISGGIKTAFCETAEEFSFTERGFSVTREFKDIAKHRVITEYAVSGESVTAAEKTVSRAEGFSPQRLNEKILPYAFLEELLCGGNVADYLSQELKDVADEICGFFGEYVGVTPPPFFRNPAETGIIRKISEERYCVDYYLFEIKDGLILNVKKTD